MTSTPPTLSSWFCLRTATRQERRAEASLKEAGFSFYCPKAVRWERIGRFKKRARVEHALFGGYMFAQIPDGLFADVEAMEGVHAVLRYTTASGLRTPRVIPTGFVEALRWIDLAGGFDKAAPDEDDGRPKPGTQMRVKSGGWWGHIATIVEMDGPNRVKTLLALFGRMNPVTLDIAQLEPV